ncbi:hypothetical protein [Lottiidibacillus patelloidae]|uniref:hypothetical protein n=1 Tax=Lottiidibacillus patelloidae TaxID=2670334 RepID=UPI0013036116|nr:hypothetical protein [Lottiidibacillus patelloidae]
MAENKEKIEKQKFFYDNEAASELTFNALLTNAYNSGNVTPIAIEEEIDHEKAIKNQ